MFVDGILCVYNAIGQCLIVWDVCSVIKEAPFNKTSSCMYLLISERNHSPGHSGVAVVDHVVKAVGEAQVEKAEGNKIYRNHKEGTQGTEN